MMPLFGTNGEFGGISNFERTSFRVASLGHSNPRVFSAAATLCAWSVSVCPWLPTAPASSWRSPHPLQLVELVSNQHVDAMPSAPSWNAVSQVAWLPLYVLQALDSGP